MCVCMCVMCRPPHAKLRHTHDAVLFEVNPHKLRLYIGIYLHDVLALVLTYWCKPSNAYMTACVYVQMYSAIFTCCHGRHGVRTQWKVPSLKEWAESQPDRSQHGVPSRGSCRVLGQRGGASGFHFLQAHLECPSQFSAMNYCGHRLRFILFLLINWICSYISSYLVIRYKNTYILSASICRMADASRLLEALMLF